MLRAEFFAVNRRCNSTKKPFMGIDHSTIGNVVIREDIRIDYDMLTQIYTLVSIRQGFFLHLIVWKTVLGIIQEA